MKSRLQVLFILPLLATITHFGNGQQELHVAFITSFEGEFDSSVTVPAVQLAREAVNRDSNILPGYKLVVELIENLTVARNFTNSEVNISERDRIDLAGCVYWTHGSVQVIGFLQ